jgi:hypothetical protein
LDSIEEGLDGGGRAAASQGSAKGGGTGVGEALGRRGGGGGHRVGDSVSAPVEEALGKEVSVLRASWMHRHQGRWGRTRCQRGGGAEALRGVVEER